MESQELAKVATALAEVRGDYDEKVGFPNGRGVSIIRNQWSHGGKMGLFEVAVIDHNGDLDFSTPVTDDVVGWQTVTDVVLIMKAVAELPAAIES